LLITSSFKPPYILLLPKDSFTFLGPLALEVPLIVVVALRLALSKFTDAIQ